MAGEIKVQEPSEISRVTELLGSDEVLVIHNGSTYTGTLSEVGKAVAVDSITSGSESPASSGAVYTALAAKVSKSDVLSSLDTTKAQQPVNSTAVQASVNAAKTSCNGYTDFKYGLGGTCGTAANAEIKEVTLNTDSTTVPREFDVVFTYGNTYGNTTATTATHPQLRIKNSANTVIATLHICDSRGHYAGKGFCNAGDTMTFRTSDTKAIIINSDVREVLDGYTLMADGRQVYSVSQVNGALANQSEFKIIKYNNGGIDFNDLFSDDSGKETMFFVYGTSSNPNTNAPNGNNSTNFIVISYNGNGRVSQLAINHEYKNNTYIRSKDYNDNWNEWERFITDTQFIKSKTLTVTTSTNGNAFFSDNDLKFDNAEVVSIWCLTDNSTICIPYKGNGTYWGFHAISDTASGSVHANKTIQVKVSYFPI